MIDAVLTVNPTTCLYDFSIGADGDIVTEAFFDTAILYSLFGEQRATEAQVPDPFQRRGWIGNAGTTYQNGSLLWLYDQERITRTVMNSIEDEAKRALQWLVDDGFAVRILGATATINNDRLLLRVTIERSRDNIETKLFDVWERTGA